ncbi:MAG: 16S rRNA (adenine(1518)-N(6)/adenine(1519)-N(6))-dimethyltransferase RsmA [Gammaproteobacteria bacterium]|nr:16S rRNA (adenine(1518)-N(6)/adenine(1519)-N(6))-dimethyltransferase RsmA [Gammaproteobacteria bacterium]
MCAPARKRFGQHFLHDRGVIVRIVAALNPEPGQRVVEIGPGRGALTAALLTALGELDAVEIDRDLVAFLQQRFGSGLRLHSGDALHFDFAALASNGPLRLIGNLPYNIATPLLFRLLGLTGRVQDMLFMLQKEVVARLVAEPGGADYGRLSVAVALRARCDALFDVGPGAFQPPPQVRSAVVRITPHPTLPAAARLQRIDQIVAKAFGQRRKHLANALKGLLTAAQIEAAGIDSSARAETVPVAGFVRLAAQLDRTAVRVDPPPSPAGQLPRPP